MQPENRLPAVKETETTMDHMLLLNLCDALYHLKDWARAEKLSASLIRLGKGRIKVHARLLGAGWHFAPTHLNASTFKR